MTKHGTLSNISKIFSAKLSRNKKLTLAILATLVSAQFVAYGGATVPVGGVLGAGTAEAADYTDADLVTVAKKTSSDTSATIYAAKEHSWHETPYRIVEDAYDYVPVSSLSGNTLTLTNTDYGVKRITNPSYNDGSTMPVKSDIFFVKGGSDDTASNNTLTINGSNIARRDVYAAFLDDFVNPSTEVTNSGTVSNNKLIVNNITSYVLDGTTQLATGSDFYAARTSNGNAKDNSLSVSNSTFLVDGNIGDNKKFIGGYGTGVVSGNSVSIDNTTMEMTSGNAHYPHVFGGYNLSVKEGSSATYGNSVTISNTTINKITGTDYTRVDAYGGSAVSDDVYNNTVTIKASDLVVSNEIAGGFVSNANNNGTYENPTYFRAGDIYGNSVSIENSTLKNYNNTSRILGGAVGLSQRDIGKAYQNTVTLTNNNVNLHVYGAWTDSGDASENNVTINGGTITGDKNIYGGFVNDSGNVSKNTVTITNSNSANTLTGIKGTTDGTVTGGINATVYGGYTSNGSATDNTLNVSGSTVKGNMYASYSNTNGAISGNTINLTNSTINGDVYTGLASGSSGYTAQGAITNNNVTITDSTLNKLYMGTTNSGDVTNNSLTITGRIYNQEINAGTTDSGDATGNKITLNKTVINDSVYSAQANPSSSSGGAKNNEVSIAESAITGSVYGGYTKNGEATGNKVTLSGTTVGSNVYGGNTEGTSNSVSDGNTVNVDNSSVSGDVIVSYSSSAASNSGISNNTLTLKDSTVSQQVSVSNVTTGDATKNSITIDNSTVGTLKLLETTSGNITDNTLSLANGNYTQDLFAAKTSSGTASGNKTTLNNVTTENNVYGGYTTSGDATGNSATITGGTYTTNVYGGFTESGNATGNNITLTDVTTNNNVYGGFTQNGDATGNTLNLNNTSTTADIVGGYSASGGTVSGNTLNLTTNGTTANNLVGFQNGTVNIITTNASTSTPLLTLTDATADTDLTGSKITLSIATSSSLSTGDQFTLINKTGTGKLDLTNSNLADASGTIYEGISIAHTYTTAQAGGSSLVATIQKSGITEQTKSLVETMAAQTAIVNAGTDQLIHQSMPQAMSVTTIGGGFTPFATVGGGSLRLNSGSHVDTHMYGVSIGAARTVAMNAKDAQESAGDTLTYGAAISYGKGSYDSYLDNGMHGEGDTKQTGLNLFARRNNASGVYYEGSVSFGRADSDYESNSLKIGSTPTHTSYDTQSYYIGAHLGVGKITELKSGDKLDTFFRYLYTHTYNDDVDIAAGGATEKYDFNAVNSHRFQLGTSYNWENGAYFGATWQYEADSDATAVHRGYSTPSPSLKGHTGIFELGWKQQNKKGWDINAGVQGYLGVERGVMFNVGSTYHF